MMYLFPPWPLFLNPELPPIAQSVTLRALFVAIAVITGTAMHWQQAWSRPCWRVRKARNEPGGCWARGSSSGLASWQP